MPSKPIQKRILHRRTLCRICGERPALRQRRRIATTCGNEQCRIAAYSTRLTKAEEWPPKADPWEGVNARFSQLAIKPSPPVRLDKPETGSITGCATAQCSETGGSGL